LEVAAVRDGRVAVLTAANEFAVERRSAPAPGSGDVLIRVTACGICGSDLKMYSGTHAFLRPPLVLGHEVIGTVEESRDGGLGAGDLVCVFPPVGCGSCYHCRHEQEQLCEAMEFFGGQRPGGLADYMVVPGRNALPLPDTIPSGHRILIEPLSVAVHAVSRAQVRGGERALVVGAGTIGLFTALVLRAHGLERVVVSEISETRLACAGALGFETVNPYRGDFAERLDELIRPEGADLVFECVGSGPTIAQALGLTRKGGNTVVVGNAPPTLELDGLALQRGDRSLVGVLMYERADFRRSMDLLADGLLDERSVSELVQSFSLERISDAFRAAKSGELDGLKAVIEL
jgi:threonine dehydrogenase-like Zn-dependent dehydrogenase